MEIIRQARLVNLEPLRLQRGIRRRHGRRVRIVVLNPGGGEVVDARTEDALVGAELPFEVLGNLILGDDRREPVRVAGAPEQNGVLFKHRPHAFQREWASAIRGHGIQRHPQGQQFPPVERIKFLEQVLGLLGAHAITDRNLRRDFGIGLPVTGINGLLEAPEIDILGVVKIFRRSRVHEEFRPRAEELGHFAATHPRGRLFLTVQAEDVKRVRRAAIERDGRDKLRTDVGPIAISRILPRPDRRIVGGGIATGPDVGPDVHVGVGAVVAVFLVPLAAELHHGGKFLHEGHDPARVDHAGIFFCDPGAVVIVHPGATRAVVRIGKIALVVPIKPTRLADVPLPRLDVRAGRDKSGGHVAALAVGKATLD